MRWARPTKRGKNIPKVWYGRTNGFVGSSARSARYQLPVLVIVNYREENGCFQREEDLIRVKGIDIATLEKFLDLVFADECP